MLWFKIGCTGNSDGPFSGSRRNMWLSWLRFRVRSGVVARRSRRFRNGGNNFLWFLRNSFIRKGSSWQFGCSVSALVRGILIGSSSNKVVSLPCPVTVEIGGMSLSSPPNLGTLTHRGAGSSETEALHPVTLVRYEVRGNRRLI